jgi:hypothetical protein
MIKLIFVKVVLKKEIMMGIDLVYFQIMLVGIKDFVDVVIMNL